MEVVLENIGKRYNNDWVFQKISFHIDAGSRKVLLGHNGSGKSTLLKIIAGYITPSEGTISWHREGSVSAQTVYAQVSIASPYLELIEEYTAEELIAFHGKFRKLRAGKQEILKRVNLHDHRHKRVADFSSGMKQRLKLGLAFYTDSPLLLLDEPCSNLDAASVAIYKALLENAGDHRTVVIASNSDEREFPGVSDQFEIA